MSNDKIQFYHNPMSRGRTIHWMLEEIGAPYETHILDFTKREHKDPKYLAINPMGKVPAIVHNGIVITEVGAIMTYLADAFPRVGLAPAVDSPARGTYLRWMFFGAGCVDFAMMDKALGRPAPERSGAIGYGTREDTIGALQTALKPGPYILGDKFSAVDLLISSQIAYGMMTKTIEAQPVFEEYVARCRNRDAFKRAN